MLGTQQACGGLEMCLTSSEKMLGSRRKSNGEEQSSFSRIIKCVYFLPSGHGNESCNLIGSQCDPDFPISDHGHSNASVSFFSVSFSFRMRAWKKNKFFTGLGSANNIYIYAMYILSPSRVRNNNSDSFPSFFYLV